MTANNRRILVLFAHPSIERSEVNSPMATATRQSGMTTFVDLYAEYPDFQINVDREQTRLREHDIIIFMHPIYWYSTPAILKEWQDLVLELGFAYGPEGNELENKIFLNAITTGGSEAAYHADGYHHFTIRELLRPLEQTAILCNMIYLPPFTLFGARTAVEEDRVAGHVDDWLRVLKALHDDHIDLENAQELPRLNLDLNAIIKGDQT